MKPTRASGVDRHISGLSIPATVVPGLRACQGHFKMSTDEWGCNAKRLVNLNHPEWARLAPARRVSVAEWEATR